MSVSPQVLAWITKALRESHADQQKEHQAAIDRLQGEHDRLQHRIHAMYVDKLDGRIDNSFWTQMSEQWRLKQDTIQQQILKHQAAERSYLDEGAAIVEIANGAHELFRKQPATEQRRLLDFVLSNSTWKYGVLTPAFRQPFDLIAETVALAAAEQSGKALKSPGHSVWLGDLDSNQD